MRSKLTWVLSWTLTIVAFVLVTPIVLWALQEAGETLPTPANQSQALAIAIYSALIPFAVQLIKSYWTTAPRLAVLAMPYVVGGLLTLLGRYTGLSGWEGFLAALGAHALYELKSTVAEHKLS